MVLGGLWKHMHAHFCSALLRSVLCWCIRWKVCAHSHISVRIDCSKKDMNIDVKLQKCCQYFFDGHFTRRPHFCCCCHWHCPRIPAYSHCTTSPHHFGEISTTNALNTLALRTFFNELQPDAMTTIQEYHLPTDVNRSLYDIRTPFLYPLTVANCLKMNIKREMEIFV